jgi:hypothetical protein
VKALCVGLIKASISRSVEEHKAQTKEKSLKPAPRLGLGDFWHARRALLTQGSWLVLLTFRYSSDNYHYSSFLFLTGFYWLPYTLVILFSASLIYLISYISPCFGTFLPSNPHKHWILYLKKTQISLQIAEKMVSLGRGNVEFKKHNKPEKS